MMLKSSSLALLLVSALGFVLPSRALAQLSISGKMMTYRTLDLDSGIQVLENPTVKKIAIANPQHAPYGQAAVAAMQKESVYDKVKDKLVLGENISQAASLVVSGSADIGIVALSLAMSPNMKDRGRYVEIPGNAYPPIDQACVILKSSKNKAAARQFLSYIKKPAIGDVLRSYGFDVPTPPEAK